MNDDYTEVLEDVMDSMNSLKDVLEPLLASPLAETLSKLSTMERAKLEVLLAYVIQDLVFMYLKTRGVDPTTHSVMSEMKRIQEYMLKIKEAEDPAKRSLLVDKEAAKRFITHAINNANAMDPRDPAFAKDTYPDPQSPNHEQLDETDEGYEGGDSEEVGSRGVDGDKATPIPPNAGTGAEGVIASSRNAEAAKRRRPAMDPFAGYGDIEPPTPSSAASIQMQRRKKPKTTNSFNPNLNGPANAAQGPTDTGGLGSNEMQAPDDDVGKANVTASPKRRQEKKKSR